MEEALITYFLQQVNLCVCVCVYFNEIFSYNTTQIFNELVKETFSCGKEFFHIIIYSYNPAYRS